MFEPAELTYLRVLDVDPSTSEYELFKLFDTYGTLDALFTPRKRQRQFAYVSYKLEEDAKNAQHKIDGTTVGGRQISVQISDNGPDKDILLCNTRDRVQKYLYERFPHQEHMQQRPNEINRYTRSDYHQEDSKGNLDCQCRTVASDKPAAEEEAADGKTENAATERVEEPEAKEMTLEEYQKVLEGERKALEALKTEERKMEVGKELASIEIAEKEERAKQLQVP